MARFPIAITKLLILSVIIVLLFAAPAFPAEPASQALEEIAPSMREMKDAMGMFLVLFLWLLLGAGTAAVSLLGRASFVNLANQLDASARDVAPWKSSLIGVLNFAVLFLIAAGLADLGPLAIISALILIFVAIMVYIGLLTTTVALGEKVLALRGDEFSDFARVISGNAALFTAALVPVLGWAFFFYVIIKSFGIALIWMVRRRSLA